MVQGTELPVQSAVLPPQINPAFPWYGILTKPKLEFTVAKALDFKGFTQYCPTYRTRRKWADRVKELHLPLFTGYVFCQFDIYNRLPILKTPGISRIISFGNDPVPIPDVEIEAIRTVLNSGFGVEPCPFLREGQRVRVTAGSMQGLEGILLKKKSDWRLVISVEMLQRSVSVEIDHESIRSI